MLIDDILYFVKCERAWKCQTGRYILYNEYIESVAIILILDAAARRLIYPCAVGMCAVQQLRDIPRAGTASPCRDDGEETAGGGVRMGASR